MARSWGWTGLGVLAGLLAVGVVYAGTVGLDVPALVDLHRRWPAFWILDALPLGLGWVGWLTGRLSTAEGALDRVRADVGPLGDGYVASTLLDAVLLVDREGSVVAANRAAAVVLGRDPVGTAIRDLLPDLDRADLRPSERTAADGRFVGVEWALAAALADGATLPVRVTCGPAAGNRVVYVVSPAGAAEGAPSPAPIEPPTDPPLGPLLERVGAVAGEDGVLVLVPDRCPLSVVAEPAALVQILALLCHCAGLDGPVRLAARQDRDRVVIDVADDQDRADDDPRTRLGLRLGQPLALAMGGSLVSAGSGFQLRLPAGASARTLVPPVMSVGPKVALVDRRTPEDREQLRLALDAAGFTAVWPGPTVGSLAAERPRAVVIEAAGHGDLLIEALAAPELDGVPVLAACSLEPTGGPTIPDGVAEVVEAPVHPVDLVRALHRVDRRVRGCAVVGAGASADRVAEVLIRSGWTVVRSSVADLADPTARPPALVVVVGEAPALPPIAAPVVTVSRFDGETHLAWLVEEALG